MSDTTSFLYETLHILWAFSPIVLPTLIVFLIDIPEFLKVWISAQHAPRMKGRNHPKMEMLSYFSLPSIASRESVVLTALLAIVAILDIFKGDSSMKTLAIYGILVVPGTYCITRLPFRPITLRVARFASGGPFFIYMNQTVSHISRLFETLAAFGICTVALLSDPCDFAQRICMAVLSVSFLHILVLGSATTNDGQKQLTLKYRGAYITIVGLAIIITPFLMFYFVKPKDGSEHTQAEVKKTRWLEKFYYFVWASFLSEFVGLCYKMDYKFALESGKILPPTVKRRVATNRSETPDEQLPDVIQVLPSFKAVFDKPYFCAALGGFVLSAISLACTLTICQMNGFAFDETFYERLAQYLNAFASPIVCASVLICAWRKGQFKEVWRYGEYWMVIPERIPVLEPAEGGSRLELWWE